jgi:hypothetical protein
MDRASKCMVCGEHTHLTSKCTEIGIPSGELSMEGASKGGHDDEEDSISFVYLAPYTPTNSLGDEFLQRPSMLAFWGPSFPSRVSNVVV